jgi:primase-polymerase (primpol)-like protein
MNQTPAEGSNQSELGSSALRASKPRALPTLFDAIPSELKACPQWVGWRFVWREGKPGEAGKWTKAPFRVDGKGAAKSTDPATWATFEQAKASMKRLGFDGIGFVFSHKDQYFGVDLDACRDKETGQLTPEASDWVNRFGTYCEVSPSGTGVKLIGLGALPEGMSGRRNATTGAECYDRGRYFTVTGQRLTESPENCEGAPDVLTAFLAHHFPKKEAAPVADRPAPSPLDMDDYELLAKANGAKDGAKFAALWSGSHAGLPGASEADMALAGLLLFWTQGDQARTEAMMRRSGLSREKWDESRGGGTYLSYTIEKAAEGKTEFYNPLKTGSYHKGGENKENSANSANPSYRDKEREREEKDIYDSPYRETSQNSQNSYFSPSDPWNEPLSPFDGFEDLPEFPSWALPESVRGFVEALATHTGVALDLPGVQILAALAAAMQKRVAVMGKPGYVEPLILWGVSIAPPGSKKSAVLRPLRAPFERFEREENEIRASQVEYSISEERTARGRLMAAEQTVSKSKGNPSVDARAELDSARHAVANLQPVRPIALLVDDATPEAVAQILSENDGRSAFLDAEGTIFGHVTGRYSQRPALEVFLKGYGCEPYRFDRTGGKDGVKRSFSIPRPAISMGIATQPQVLADLRENAAVVGRGFIQRCLFSIVPKVRAPFYSPEVPHEVSAAWSELVRGLLNLSPSLNRGDDGEMEPHLLRLDAAAAELYLGFYESLQDELEEESHGSAWAGWLEKGHGTCLRLAGVLHMAAHGRGGAELPIGEETMVSAIELARYFHARSRVALSSVKKDLVTEHAQRLLSWARRHWERASQGASEKAIRDILRWTEIETQAALFLLLERGYVRRLEPVEREPGTRGRKPSPEWQFHPSVACQPEWSVEV